MELKSALKAWVVRDKGGKLYLYFATPRKYSLEWLPNIHTDYFEIDRDLFPDVKWEDEEPKEIEISIRNNIEKSKIKSALSFLCRFSLFVFFLSCTVLGILQVIQWIIRQTFLT